MSCRIERLSDEENTVVLRVSGRIEAEHVDMLKEMHVRERGRLVVDLKEVLLVDRDALVVLASFEGNGIELRNCPAYVREWIVSERAVTEGARDLPPRAIDDAKDP